MSDPSAASSPAPAPAAKPALAQAAIVDAAPRPNYFRTYLTRTDDRMLLKLDHYLDVYHDLLRDWQGRDVTFMEIGIFKGGSIDLWKGFFGPGSTLVFLDIDPACQAFAGPGVHVEIGDQADPVFLKSVAEKYGPFDIIVDDGGHKMDQQATSLRHLWPTVKNRGLYVVEDTHTSYWPGFGGGFRQRGSFIEIAKDLIDRMHSWYTDQDEIFPLHPAARQVESVKFYDSMIVVEKNLKDPPKTISSKNGVVQESRKMLTVRGRKSIF